MTKVFVYELASCRGDDWTNKIELDKEFLISMLGKVIAGADVEDISEEVEDKYEDYEDYEAAMAILNDTEFYPSRPIKWAMRNLNKIRKGTPFGIMKEESTLGVAMTKAAARKICLDTDVPYAEEW